MKVWHLILGPGTSDIIGNLKDQIKKGDVVVVAPDSHIEKLFNDVADKQLIKRADAKDELDLLGMYMTSLSPDTGYKAEVKATIAKIHSSLTEGMTWQVLDESLINYLKAILLTLTSKCVASFLTDSLALDGREVILCESNNGMPLINWKLTENNTARLQKDAISVVAGGFGRKLQGDTIDLGCAGTELTANVIGAITKAESVVYVLESYQHNTIEELTYDEASQFFASGHPIYPPVLTPVKNAEVPVEIYSLADSRVVVRILKSPSVQKDNSITGVICSEPMTLVTIYGTGLLGSIGISSAIFGALAENGVNIHFISQSSSEYSISFAVKRTDRDTAAEALKSLLNAARLSADLSYDAKEVKIVSVFGYRMRNVPGISGRIFTALGDAKVNIIASSQGGEELCISIVVAEDEADTAVASLKQI